LPEIYQYGIVKRLQLDPTYLDPLIGKDLACLCGQVCCPAEFLLLATERRAASLNATMEPIAA